MKNENLSKETFEEKISKKLREHRNNLNLTKLKVAQDVCKSFKTYERWEKEGVRNIHDLIKLFQVLKFTTTEVIDLLELPPLKADDLKKIFSDEDALKRIKVDGFCLYVHDKCTYMDDFTLEKLIDILFAERLKRHNKQE